MAYDVIFLNYDEPNAEAHWQRLLRLAPHARRVDRIDGILRAHRECARRSHTSHVFVVDADNDVLDFDFRYQVGPGRDAYVHLWYARNPVNGLEYGWGGIKLFPRRALLDCYAMPIDMTTSLPLHIVPRVASITHFNSSPLGTWRSAFREVVKLSLQRGREAQLRRRIWCASAQGAFAGECRDGARAGRDYVHQHRKSPEMLRRINDYDWLAFAFRERIKSDE